MKKTFATIAATITSGAAHSASAMRMKRSMSGLAACAAMMLAGSAQAVTYSFAGGSGTGTAFVLDYNGGYITSQQVFTASQLVTSTNVGSVQFCFVGNTCGLIAYTADTDSIYIITSNGTVTLPDGGIVPVTGVGLEYDFDATAFTMTGVHNTIPHQYSKNAALAVDVPLSAVPEPATWAMMLAGFGLVGGLARRRGLGHRRLARV